MGLDVSGAEGVADCPGAPGFTTVACADGAEGPPAFWFGFVAGFGVAGEAGGGEGTSSNIPGLLGGEPGGDVALALVVGGVGGGGTRGATAAATGALTCAGE